MNDVKEALIHQSSTILDAFKCIEKNQLGAAFVHDDQQRVVGLVTDGDLRRTLLSNKSAETKLVDCMNPNFFSVTSETSREVILKLLDHKYNLIPVLSPKGQLMEVLSRRSFPIKGRNANLVRAKSPVRISFGGGGTDLTHFFFEHGGAVLNATINRFAHATLLRRNDSQIVISASNFDVELKFTCVEEFLKNPGKFGLLASVISLIKPDFGFELTYHCDFPVGSGLGGSSALMAAVLGCFNEIRDNAWDEYELSELAFQAERLFLGVKGGWQDQYATVFGGFNFIEFNKESNVVHPLRIPRSTISELQENIVLVPMGGEHNSGDVHKKQEEAFKGSEDIQKLVHKNRSLVYEQKTLLLRGQLRRFGETLDETWKIKRSLSSHISNDSINLTYDTAMKSGAFGGKLLGAGGAGYLMLFVPPERRGAVAKSLRDLGLSLETISFYEHGLESWTVKES